MKRVLFIGSSQTAHIAKIYERCGWKFRIFDKTGSKIRRSIRNVIYIIQSNLIYIVGVFDVVNFFPYRLAKVMNKSIIIHWIGTDVDRFVNGDFSKAKELNNRCVNIAGSQLLQKELKSVGIDCSVIPIVPTDYSFEPLPPASEHSVIAYIPKGREDYYGMQLLNNVAKQLPNLTFHIVANDGDDIDEKMDNVKFMGRLDPHEMKALYQKSSILFRYPKHDGLSMMVLEALGLGRAVVYKYEFPYVNTPSSSDVNDVVTEFKRIISSPPVVNYEAVSYINTEFSEEKQIEIYKKNGIV